MQFNGIEQEHNRGMHQITNCMHDHSHYKLEGELHGAAASAPKQQAMQSAQQQKEGDLSLSAWLERTLGKGKKLLLGIWGSSEVPGTGEPGDKTGAAQVLAQLGESESAERGNTAASGINSSVQSTSPALHTPQIAAAATAAEVQNVQNNPYFSAVEDAGSRQKSLLQKMRVKFKDITGQLAGQLPGRFFGAGKKGTFQTGKEKPKEDLRRHSRYRKDEVEIDCILTDDSYLLDSYDRKGSYSKLTTKK